MEVLFVFARCVYVHPLPPEVFVALSNILKIMLSLSSATIDLYFYSSMPNIVFTYNSSFLEFSGLALFILGIC